ncbi:UDP-glucose 4-epimerase GalE [Amphritea balenae]|uniref:UDP-glucose 4-epimerase n=1 Tax=Amphritea balenae TaxID=452629 RepID=A0A3P1SSQ8_9GAMM|nr:UDP-glucose 4-epimerase GalE [Amphritea balenae]RRD00168.1 UDP-glucose 4-epimerase GalE [Amphritea balenae]GGK77222.1 UDP-glucose 4-epimerase [Amphritea balenae]
MAILVTGGAGYIGSHTVVMLLEAGYDVVVLDNLCNSHSEVFNRVETITSKRPAFVEGDIRDAACLKRLFDNYPIESVIHFAGLKAVGESSQSPLEYYQNNVHGSVVLCQAMAVAGVKKLVFSSSATVYGEDAPVPYVETMPRGKTSNPYGTSKAMVEQILTDLCASDAGWSVALLRYFNPIGAHSSGLIGEDPQGIPNNLMPFISQVAVGKRERLSIFGNDYDTDDGTCVRDYLHVMDLADGHLKSLECLQQPGTHIYNLGTGQGLSVLAMVNSFVNVTGVTVPYEFAPRRDGDLPAFWANACKANNELGWQTQFSLEDMMRDTWNWQSNNPEGYK